MVDIPMRSRRTEFQVSISGRGDGTIEAIYLAVSGRKVARTDEVIADHMLVDYDRSGNVVGVEILAPVRLRDVTCLVKQGSRASLRRFLSRSVPHEFVTS
jgi:uncharacterized protein YuzE